MDKNNDATTPQWWQSLERHPSVKPQLTRRLRLLHQHFGWLPTPAPPAGIGSDACDMRLYFYFYALFDGGGPA